MEWLVTDQGSNFVASYMKNLTKEARVRHHFTTPIAHGQMALSSYYVAKLFKQAKLSYPNENYLQNNVLQ